MGSSIASPTSAPTGPGGSAAPDIYQSGPANSGQWIRKFSLTISAAGGQNWTLSDSSSSGALSGGTTTIDEPLRITFSCRSARVSSRQYLVCKVYNLALANLAATLGKNLYNWVTLRAGYVNGNFGTIFAGQLINFRVGREPTMTETYLELHAQGDFWSNLITVSQTFPNGVNATAVVKSIGNLMSMVGTAIGTVTGLSAVPFIRGRAYYGMAVDVLQKHGLVYQANNIVNVTAHNSAAPTAGAAVTVNAKSGLIGMAEITGPNGVEFKVNLNSTLQLGSVVTLDNKDINIIGGGNNSGSGSVGNPNNVPSTFGPSFGNPGFYVDPSADGTYIVQAIEHAGDSRGNEWETRVTAWPNGALATPATDTGILLPGVGAGPSPQQMDIEPALPTDNDLTTAGF